MNQVGTPWSSGRYSLNANHPRDKRQEGRWEEQVHRPHMGRSSTSFRTALAASHPQGSLVAG
jgi:hypothetical protein